MAYATKYYDYQIAVVFAILLGGLLLLALVVGAIYFICVVNMRGKKGGISRVPSGRSTLRSTTARMEWPQRQQQLQYAPPQQLQYDQPPYEGYPPQQYYGQYQQPQQQQQYDQQPAARVRELQPEYFQQQGPISYTTVHPFDQQQQQSYQPQSVGPPAVPPTTYHMSSV